MEPGELDNCPACGSGSTRRVYQRVYQHKEWTLAQCRGCGLHFTAPSPTAEDLEAFYAGDYHAELRRAGGAEASFGAKYRRYAATLRRHLPAGRVLDVGCSTGLLVRMLRDNGYEAEGIEMNGQSAAWGREHYGVSIDTRPLEAGRYPPRSLDAVLLTDVLEHTPHPGRFLRSVRELLVPGGYVLVTFPDIGSVESRYQRALARLLRRDWLWSTCHIPLHVWEFTRGTAEATFAEAGFKVVEFRRSQSPAETETEQSVVLRALSWPSRLLSRPGIARRLGTQMEFVVQKLGDASENDGAARPNGEAASLRDRRRRPAAPILRPAEAGAPQRS